MDARPQKPRRNSRWTRDPVIDDGDAVVVYPTDRDIEIFKLLTRYRYLPSDYIHALVGGSFKGLNRRLNLLSRKPNLYIARPHQQRDCASANHRPLIYELDERGSRVLRERGLSFQPKTYHRNFSHELMVAQIMASIELGTKRNTHVRFISWPRDFGERQYSPSDPRVPRTRHHTGRVFDTRRAAGREPHGRRSPVRPGARHRRQAQLPLLPRD